MSLELALRLTEILLALAFIQQSAEHMAATKNERALFLPRLLLSLALLSGLYSPLICLALLIHALFVLRRFQGPYNGGSDRMSLLVLLCLTAAQIAPNIALQESTLGYLALQLILSYFISGWVKVTNPEWRAGRALRDVFLFSAYPVSESLRGWADKPRMMLGASWAVIGLELVFPFMLLAQPTLIIALVLAFAFHIANACLFGLNRFVWFWLAAYPSIIWLQSRLFDGALF